jgi:hypothetical protein
MLKYLRIAVTALGLTGCVLVIALWVQSYSGRSSREVFVTADYRYYIQSLGGTFVYGREKREFISIELFRVYEKAHFDNLKTAAGIKIHRGYKGRGVEAVSISYWLICLIGLCGGAIPWIPWRFSLRTLIIATTVVAVVLGVVVAVAG